MSDIFCLWNIQLTLNWDERAARASRNFFNQTVFAQVIAILELAKLMDNSCPNRNRSLLVKVCSTAIIEPVDTRSRDVTIHYKHLNISLCVQFQAF